MKDQPEALRLANFLEMHWCGVDMPEAKTAAELRRLHQFAEDQIGRATAAEAALQMTKATHALQIAAVEAQRDALLEELRWIATVNATDREYQAKARTAIKAVEEQK